MFCPKLSKVFLLVLMILLSSNHRCTQGKPIAMIHRRFNLSHSDETTKGTMTQGTVISPKDGGGALGNVEDARPTTPGHSPGAGHAATDNRVGRKLFGV
ncbi:hypothetical protein QOZ80_3AG0251140 [Eleusine coracana subsp. coracana]|nr:hypothetical protein QOZ80_3AG0251140 [Eleusine coracana subsp. coracana]